MSGPRKMRLKSMSRGRQPDTFLQEERELPGYLAVPCADWVFAVGVTGSPNPG